jgi:tetratricopeptide (TPR) repeat protein
MNSDRAKIFRDDGEAHHRWGNLDRARECYLRALDCEGGSGDHRTLYRMAELFLEKQEPSAALEYYILAIQADGSNLLHKQRFLDICGALRLERYNADVEDTLLRCLTAPGLDFSNAGPLWSTILQNNPEFAPFYTDLRLFEKKFDPAPLLKPCFLEGLRKLSIHEPGFEDFIRRLRQWLLMGLPSRLNISRADYVRLAESVAV